MTRKLDELFCLSKELDPLRQQVMTLRTLQKQIDQLLDEEFRERVFVANLREGTLYLHTASALAAAKLRHRLPSLLAELRTGVCISEIKLKVRPAIVPALGLAAPRPPRVRALGPRARSAITELCARLPADASLRMALTRLLARAPVDSRQGQQNDALECEEAQIDQGDAQRQP
jgi:hypothetical protein